MDSEGDWNAATFFSPSKARVQQAQAKDWAVVDAWLSKRYSSKRLPAFERNEETLQALLSLANANESADDRRSYIDRIDKIALSSASKRVSANDKICQLMVSGSTEIDALAETVVTLDCPTADVSAMATSICNLTAEAFLLDQEVQRAKAQIEIVKTEQARLKLYLQELRDGAFERSPDTAEKTAEWLLDSKHMRAKVQEYDERLSVTDPIDSGSARLGTIMQQKKEMAADAAQLDDLNTQLESFRSLPTNAKAAQTKVDSAKKELLALVKRRDRLFEQLAEAG